MTGERTRAITALLRVHNLGMDTRRPLTADQVAAVARWHRRDGPIGNDTARTEAIRLARCIGTLDSELAANKTRMTDLVEIIQAAPLLEKPGIGPVSAATFPVQVYGSRLTSVFDTERVIRCGMRVVPMVCCVWASPSSRSIRTCVSSSW